MSTSSPDTASSARLDVVVIEDEQLLCDLLGEWVAAQPDLHLVGVYRSVGEARRELPAAPST